MGLDFDGDDGDDELDFTYTSLAPDALAWDSNASALAQDTTTQDEDSNDTNTAPYSEQDSNSANAATYNNQNANDALDSLLKEFTTNNSKTTESLNSALAEEMEDAFSTDADEEMIEDTINILKAKGFEKVENLPYETLEVLINRAEVFDNEGHSINKFINDVCGKTISDFGNFYRDFKASPAINYYHDDDAKALKSYNIDYEGTSGLYLKRIRECITNNFSQDIDVSLQTGEDFSQEKTNQIVEFVYNRLHKDPSLVEIIDNNFESFIQNVQSTLYNILQVNRRALAQNRTTELYRDNTSKYLLKEELQMFQELLPTTSGDNASLDLKFIKQIFTDGNEYYFRCETCGEKVMLDKPVAVILSFPLNGAAGKRALVLPKIFRCKCGQRHFFTKSEIQNLEETVKPVLKSGINKLTKKLIDMSKGSALLKYEVPINTVQSNWSYCITPVKGDKSNSARKKDDSVSFSTVSDAEFKQAVKNFYTLLNTFNPNEIPKVMAKQEDSPSINFSQEDPFSQDDDDFFSQVDSFFDDGNFLNDSNDSEQSVADGNNETTDEDNDKYVEIGNLTDRSDLLSYKEVAMYFCKILSIDYPVIKNKALFSLIFAINNNKVLNEYLDCSNIYNLKSILKFIDTSAEFLKKNVLPDEQQTNELVSIAVFFGEQNTFEKLEAKKDDKAAYCQELLHTLESEKELIQKEAEKYEKERKRIIIELSNSIESLAFTQIINISQFELRDILNVITDQTIYKLFDLITDRMIITNYAEDFYDRYRNFNILNKNSLKNSLNVRTQAKHISQGVKNTIMKRSEDLGIQLSEGELYNNFRMVDALTQSNLSLLNDLNSAFTNADYYKFCTVVLKISELPHRLDTLISDEYTEQLYAFIDDFKEEAKRVITEFKSPEGFYLQSFSPDEIALAKTYKKQLHFYRYMPKRLDGESITDYLDRYERMLHEGGLTKYNSVNYGSNFDNYTKYFGLLFSCSALYETTYHSFTTATFVTQFVKTVMASRSNKTQTGKLFGISTPILNLIDYEIDQQKSNIDFENINLLLKALSGIYITSVKQRVDVLLENLSTYVVKNTSTLAKSVNNFNMRDWLQKVVSDDEVNFTPYKDVPEITDYSDSIVELYTYTEDEELKKYF